jgi:hypothetical protein
VTAYLYPIIVLIFLYATWGISALKLGRPPIPYREYPDGVELSVLGSIAAILQLLAPLAIPGGVLVSVVHPFAIQNNRTTKLRFRILSFLTYLAFCAIAFVTLSRDPYRVFDWFWD